MKRNFIKRLTASSLLFSGVLAANIFSVSGQEITEKKVLTEEKIRKEIQTENRLPESLKENTENKKTAENIDFQVGKSSEKTSSEKVPQDDLSEKVVNPAFAPKLKNPFDKSELGEKKEKSDNDDDDKKKKNKRVDTEEKKWEISENSIEYGIEGGFAPDIATWMSGPKPWDISGHKHLLGSFRWGKILGTRGIVTFSYAIEFTPLSVAIGNQTENKEHRTNPLAPPTKRTNNFGAAINPTSFRFIFLPQYRLRPFIFSGLGISYHLKPVPVESGTKWNLAWDFGFGGQYMLSKTKAIQFGYRYYHLSNVYLSNYNPGYNSNVYFVGYSIFKK